MTAECHFHYWARLAGLSTFFGGIAIYRGYEPGEVIPIYLSVLAIGLVPGVISYAFGSISQIHHDFLLPGFRTARETASRYWKQTAILVAMLVLITAWLTISGDADDDIWVTGRATIVDGDTVKVDGRTIRLVGIDAPEMRQTCKGRVFTWNCGEKATEALDSKVGWSKIRCRTGDQDRYGRILATCHLGETNLNEWMVRKGWAVAYRDDRSYAEAELLARDKRLGIWDSKFDMPWVWRENNRKK